MGFFHISLFILIAYATTGEAIHCFQCTFNDPDCDDLRSNDTNSQYYKECKHSAHGTPILCRKIRVKILDPDIPWRVYRSCGYMTNRELEDSYCVESDSDFKKERSCECRTDGCNSSPPTTSVVGSILNIVLPVAAIMLAAKN